MGVEYTHYLLVRDKAWTGGIDVARKVHAALERRGLVQGEPELFDLNGGRKKKVKGGLSTRKAAPPNLLVRYEEIEAGPPVAEAMGPSHNDSVSEEDRYFQGISVLLGTDYRLGPISESLFIEAIDATPLPAGIADFWEFDDSYSGGDGAPPPTTRVDAKRALPEGFTGVWRAGVMLDCGKDLPRMDEYGFGVQAASSFVAELEAAFGTPLVEVGRIY